MSALTGADSAQVNICMYKFGSTQDICIYMYVCTVCLYLFI